MPLIVNFMWTVTCKLKVRHFVLSKQNRSFHVKRGHVVVILVCKLLSEFKEFVLLDLLSNNCV